MTRVQILLVVLLVAGVAAMGCYWLWASRPPPVSENKGSASTPRQAQKRNDGEHEQAEGSLESENARKGSQPKEAYNQNVDAAEIQSAQQAIQVAKKLLGWQNEGNYTAEKIVVKNCIVPFIRKEVVGKSAWKVSLKRIKLKLERGEVVEENPFVKELECVILAETGQLLQIESKIPKGVVIKPDRIPVEKAEVRYGSERIKGFPSEPSQLSFKVILQRAFEAEGHWVSTAKQIVAFYVVDARGENEEIRPSQPLWLIHVRGFSPPMPLPSGGPPLPGHKHVNLGTIDYMRLLFTGDGKELGRNNMLAPK